MPLLPEPLLICIARCPASVLVRASLLPAPLLICLAGRPAGQLVRHPFVTVLCADILPVAPCCLLLCSMCCLTTVLRVSARIPVSAWQSGQHHQGTRMHVRLVLPPLLICRALRPAGQLVRHPPVTVLCADILPVAPRCLLSSDDRCIGVKLAALVAMWICKGTW